MDEYYTKFIKTCTEYYLKNTLEFNYEKVINPYKYYICFKVLHENL